MATAVVSAPGKINLTLDILGRREDGYHEMEMLMHAVSLENTVRLTTRDRPGICLSCSNPAVPTGEKNLAYRAAQAFFAAWGHSVGLEIRVEKRVPMENELCAQPEKSSGHIQNLNQDELALLAALRKNPMKFKRVLTLLRSAGLQHEDPEKPPDTKKAVRPLPE